MATPQHKIVKFNVNYPDDGERMMNEWSKAGFVVQFMAPAPSTVGEMVVIMVRNSILRGKNTDAESDR